MSTTSQQQQGQQGQGQQQQHGQGQQLQQQQQPKPRTPYGQFQMKLLGERECKPIANELKHFFDQFVQTYDTKG